METKLIRNPFENQIKLGTTETHHVTETSIKISKLRESYYIIMKVVRGGTYVETC